MTAPEDGHQPPGRLIRAVQAHGPSEKAPDESAGDAEQDRDDEPAGITPGVNSFAMTPTTSPKRIQDRIPMCALSWFSRLQVSVH